MSEEDYIEMEQYDKLYAENEQLRLRAERAEAGLKELAEACDKAKADRDKALAANKLLVEALEKLRVRLETGSVDWEIATDALAAVKQP